MDTIEYDFRRFLDVDLSKITKISMGILSLPVAILLAYSTIGVQLNQAGASSDENCDPSYPEVCITSPPPNLNCDDVPYNNIQVIGSDPHGFDREGDGIGCES
jgi:hypothetical protein